MTWLGACADFRPDAPVVDPIKPEARVTLPALPDDLRACLRKTFPEIPDRDLTQSDVARILGEAIVLDRAKTACGERALAWIEQTRRALGR